MSDPPPKRPMPDWLTTKPIAHRGLHTRPQTPENSLRAFAASVEAGFPIELDVRLLSDGAVAVFHDHDLERLTGEAGLLEGQSTSGIKKRRLLGTMEQIPLLSEALALVAGRVPLLVEIKTDSLSNGRLEQAVLQALAGYRGPFAIQSFSPASIAYLAVEAPQIRRGQLSTDDDWHDALKKLEAPLPDFLAYSLSGLPTPLTSALRSQGFPVLSWTIRTPEQQEQAAIVSDNYIFETVPPLEFRS